MDDNSLVSYLEENLTKAGILHGEKIEGHKVIKIKNLYPAVTNTKQEDSFSQIVDTINKFKNEYLLGTAEIDVGRLTSKDESVEKSNTVSLGGVHAALSNASILVKQIVSETLVK